MIAKGKTSIKESKKMTTPILMRLAGVLVMLAGLCFIVIGMFHPVNVPEAVTTVTWVNVHIFAIALSFFGLLGMVGLYARQVQKSGWLGLAGFVLLSGWFGLTMPFAFAEAFILPRLTSESPAFIASLIGMLTSSAPGEVDLGILPTLWNISGPMYILGSLLFGIATFRAGVLPRWAGALLAIGALLIPIGAMVPPEYQPEVAMIPVGLAFAWLGYALFAERQAKTLESLLDQKSIQPEPSKAA